MLRWRNIRRLGKCSQYLYSTTNSSNVNVKVLDANSEDQKLDVNNTAPSSFDENESASNHSKLTAAAFATLKEISQKSRKSSLSSIEAMIISASDIDSLLSVAEEPLITKRHALKVLSVLDEWTQKGKIKLNDFETDVRFSKISQLLGRSTREDRKGDLADLSIVLGVTADQQAAKLISSVSLQQMIKILISLSQKKRRSTPLLRSLSYNIGKSSKNLNIKEASDILFSCATLNYPDDVLIEKTSTDILVCLKDNKKPAVVNSIINSLGILRYRDTDLLNNICHWLIENKELCGSKEFTSMLITLANVNYIPNYFTELYQIFKPAVNELEVEDYSTWVNVVWSLIVLEQYEEKAIDSVLNPNFISKLNFTTDNKDIVLKLKLLNINGAAKQMGSKYKGYFLENSEIFHVTSTRAKDKQLMLDSVLDSLSNIVKISDYIEVNVNTGMGFVIDAECFLNSKHEFVKLSEEEKKDCTR